LPHHTPPASTPAAPAWSMTQSPPQGESATAVVAVKRAWLGQKEWEQEWEWEWEQDQEGE
jgi:hypothetical protein